MQEGNEVSEQMSTVVSIHILQWRQYRRWNVNCFPGRCPLIWELFMRALCIPTSSIWNSKTCFLIGAYQSKWLFILCFSADFQQTLVNDCTWHTLLKRNLRKGWRSMCVNVTIVCMCVFWVPKWICNSTGCFLCDLHFCGFMPIKLLSCMNPLLPQQVTSV